MAIKRERSNYLIQSVTHALEVLEALSVCRNDKKPEIGITELGKQLGLHKNNVFRLLATLGLRGYVQQNPATENYTLGPACLKLGQSYLLSSDLISRIRPLMQKLNQNTHETCSFARLINTQVHFPISIASPNAVCVSPRVGESGEFTESITGKLLMAHIPAEKWPENMPAAMKKELKVMNSEESVCKEMPGDIICAAMIVRGLGHSPIGAVEVMAPAYRADQKAVLSEVRKIVAEINSCFAADEQPLRKKIEKETTTVSESMVSAAEVVR